MHRRSRQAHCKDGLISCEGWKKNIQYRAYGWEHCSQYWELHVCCLCCVIWITSLKELIQNCLLLLWVPIWTSSSDLPLKHLKGRLDTLRICPSFLCLKILISLSLPFLMEHQGSRKCFLLMKLTAIFQSLWGLRAASSCTKFLLHHIHIILDRLALFRFCAAGAELGNGVINIHYQSFRVINHVVFLFPELMLKYVKSKSALSKDFCVIKSKWCLSDDWWQPASLRNESSNFSLSLQLPPFLKVSEGCMISHFWRCCMSQPALVWMNVPGLMLCVTL